MFKAMLERGSGKIERRRASCRTLRPAHFFSRCWSVVVVLVLAAGVPNAETHAQDDQEAAVRVSKILNDFGRAWNDENWKPNYMRPLDDAGWKQRMTALREIVRQGPAARADLVQALKAGSPPVRALAAQALGYCAAAAALPALAESAEHDADAMVRLYAADSLGMLGGRGFDKLLRRLEAGEKNRDVQRHLRYAQDREGQALNPAVTAQLQAWKIEQLASAALGKTAPDFELLSIDGRRLRLSDYRGKSAVVLVFVYGDT